MNKYGRDWTGGSRVVLILGRLVWRWAVLIKKNELYFLIRRNIQKKIFYFACWYEAGDGWLELKILIEIKKKQYNYGAGATRRIWCCWDEGIGGRRPLGAGGRRPLREKKHIMILKKMNSKKMTNLERTADGGRSIINKCH